MLIAWQFFPSWASNSLVWGINLTLLFSFISSPIFSLFSFYITFNRHIELQFSSFLSNCQFLCFLFYFLEKFNFHLMLPFYLAPHIFSALSCSLISLFSIAYLETSNISLRILWDFFLKRSLFYTFFLVLSVYTLYSFNFSVSMCVLSFRGCSKITTWVWNISNINSCHSYLKLKW